MGANVKLISSLTISPWQNSHDHYHTRMKGLFCSIISEILVFALPWFGWKGMQEARMPHGNLEGRRKGERGGRKGGMGSVFE